MKIWNTLVCVWIGVIRGAVLGNVELVLTSSPLTATDGEHFTLICSITSGFLVNMAWLQNYTAKVITQLTTNNCTKQELPMRNNNIKRLRVSCNDTVHSIEFRFNSTTDQGGWQCGMYVNTTYIYPRSNIHNIVASPLISTQSLSTMTRYMETTSEPGTVTSQKGVASPVMSTTARYMGTSSEPGAMTSQRGSFSFRTQVSTDDSDSDTIYIVVGAVGGAVLLAVVVVGIMCIRRRRQAAHHQNDMKEESNGEATPVYQNTASFHTVSDSSAAVTKPEKTQQDDPVVPEDVNTQNMYESLTSVEMHIYRRLK